MDGLRRLSAAVPLASTVFLVYAIAGAIALIGGSLIYGSYADNLLAIGVACGAIGIPRAIDKAHRGIHATGVLRLIEKAPIPSIVFVTFLIASTVSLIAETIEFGAFSDNVLKVGIACGAIGVPRVLNRGSIPAVTHVVGEPPDSPGIGV